MADRHIRSLIDHLRAIIGPSNADTLTDAQLLERFISQRDEVAFELIVRRYGSLVMRVCRRILPARHDAEDAFQATFLVLVRKARSIGKRESVASWLYKVAYRVALRVNRRAYRDPIMSLSAEAVAVPAAESADWQELRPILDEEVRRLPEKYRTPVLLCYLAGKTQQKAAREIGCPKGT